jgi:hypothetical protein
LKTIGKARRSTTQLDLPGFGVVRPPRRVRQNGPSSTPFKQLAAAYARICHSIDARADKAQRESREHAESVCFLLTGRGLPMGGTLRVYTGERPATPDAQSDGKLLLERHVS